MALQDFLHAARVRGLSVPEAATGPDLFRLVRDLPYRRPSDNRPGTLIAEWCGTCSGKHGLLHALLTELGVESRLMIATYRYAWPGPGPAPGTLSAVLRLGPVPDVHTFLTVRAAHEWLPVDATWPLAAASLGLPVNAEWVPGRAQRISCLPPLRAWPVPPDRDPGAYKEEVVRAWCGAERSRREALIAALTDALADLLAAGSAAP